MNDTIEVFWVVMTKRGEVLYPTKGPFCSVEDAEAAKATMDKLKPPYGGAHDIVMTELVVNRLGD